MTARRPTLQPTLDSSACPSHLTSRHLEAWLADPEFASALTVAYNFELVQNMMVKVFDADQAQSDVHQLELSQQDLLGSYSFVLAQLVQNGTLQQQKLSQAAKGYITVTANEVVQFKKSLFTGIECKGLDNKDGCVACSIRES
jgi:hypothetical protein